jgi:hypothetical protein
MESHALGRVHLQPRRASVATTTILQVGALAGISAGLLMAAWQMVVAAIAQNPTAVPGIHQTLWTPPEGIWSVVFGVHHFHGSFHFIPVFGGIVAHLGNSLIVGILGIALLTAILGRRPNPAAALELVGRPHDLRHDPRLARQRAAEKEQRRGRRGVSPCGLTTATPFHAVPICQSSVMTTLPLARPCSTYASASRVWSKGNVLSMTGRSWPAS